MEPHSREGALVNHSNRDRRPTRTFLNKRNASNPYLILVAILTQIPHAAAKINWETLIEKSRQISMSGLIGLLDTQVLWAQPGTEQPEFWRILQGLVGVGSLRILSKVCTHPCWGFLHQIHGVKPPEAVEARDFWLNQESWTEIGRLGGMTQEDTSYHRINQGSGPQCKIFWERADAEVEKKWWETSGESGSTASSTSLEVVETKLPDKQDTGHDVHLRTRPVLGDDRDSLEICLEKGPNEARHLDAVQPAGRSGADVTEGTTDKWWMDRWQTEIMACSYFQNITLEDACKLATTVYFGRQIGRKRQIFAGIVCLISTAGSFTTATFTDWSFIVQFVALSSLGYMVNRTASLRGWKFAPSPALKDQRPSLYADFPDYQDDKVIIRVAIQSSGLCKLRGVFSFPRSRMEAAKNIAQQSQGRYRAVRESTPRYTPYSDEVQDIRELKWISYEVQSSFYGLVCSVTPDNVLHRSFGVVIAMIYGIALLIVGFGASIPEGKGGIVLAVFATAMCISFVARRKEARWTMGEFALIDLSRMQLPEGIKERLTLDKDIAGLWRDREWKLTRKGTFKLEQAEDAV
ncbi:hypothetical protein BJ508DRAFT_377367 [Ascobolus immersus RN42]|uniref:Uncharacterized protein n=1 Tax=Ascobolus immersus RN42 TaxID=1160509 RepID=A0A3N4I1M6_ASCIM|nr:hypothetical protein BJ508DRAFT_377367 [Ascobolus immersus RN42]